MAKTNVGVDMALVNLKSGGTALVPRGADLPTGLADGEEKRLSDLGVFTEPKTSTAPAAPTQDPRIAQLEAQLAEETTRREAAEKAVADAAAAASK